MVSTHSRPKAAGDCLAFSYHLLVCFNTQPPEGGWTKSVTSLARLPSFNTQPPEGGWGQVKRIGVVPIYVSTHSRPKAAGPAITSFCGSSAVSTHSRPKAAGYRTAKMNPCFLSFNTQPPEGGWACLVLVIVGSDNVSTHSRPKAAGYAPILAARLITGFNTQPPEGGWESEARK